MEKFRRKRGNTNESTKNKIVETINHSHATKIHSMSLVICSL